MRIFTVLIVCLALSFSAYATEGPTIETGKALFESPKLGTSGKNCATCHPGGKGLEDSIYLDETELIKMNNLCIRKPLKGKPLDPASTEMDSLVLYIRSLYPAAE
jgi:cytochrome c